MVYSKRSGVLGPAKRVASRFECFDLRTSEVMRRLTTLSYALKPSWRNHPIGSKASSTVTPENTSCIERMTKKGFRCCNEPCKTAVVALKGAE